MHFLLFDNANIFVSHKIIAIISYKSGSVATNYNYNFKYTVKYYGAILEYFGLSTGVIGL